MQMKITNCHFCHNCLFNANKFCYWAQRAFVFISVWSRRCVPNVASALRSDLSKLFANSASKNLVECALTYGTNDNMCLNKNTLVLVPVWKGFSQIWSLLTVSTLNVMLPDCSAGSISLDVWWFIWGWGETPVMDEQSCYRNTDPG